MPALAAAQMKSDQRLIDWCDAADDAALEATVDMDRETSIQRDLARHVLMHLLTHQVHHRGQAHAMLSGTAIKPPQLDEFLMPSETRFRTEDLAAIGWTEEDLFGRSPQPRRFRSILALPYVHDCSRDAIQRAQRRGSSQRTGDASAGRRP